LVSTRRGSAQALSGNGIPPEWTAIIRQRGTVSSSTIGYVRCRYGSVQSRCSSRAVETSGKVGCVEVAHIEKRTRHYGSDVESLETVTDFLGSNRLLALHIRLVAKLRSGYRILHPLEKLVIGDKPNIRLGRKTLYEADHTILLCCVIRQTRVVCQVSGMDIDTERLAVAVIMTIKVGVGPVCDISRRASKVDIHKLRDTGVI
jgi:hypothetical protein